MDDWDPRKEAFENKHFNSYNEGVGRDLSGNSKHNKGVRLYVQNIPESLGKTGFYNLFAEYGKVLEHKLIISDGDQSRKSYGFITMQNMLDAEKAIHKLNRLRLGQYVLKVTPAISEEEKIRRKKLKQSEEQLQSFLHRDAGDRSNLQARQQPRMLDPATHVQSVSGLDLSKGGRPWSQSFGIGRGSNIQVTERGDGNVYPQRNLGTGAAQSDQVKRMKECIVCGREECVNLCSRCKMYYCSVECQKRDWPRHKDMCVFLGEVIRSGTDIKTGSNGDTSMNNPHNVYSYSEGQAINSYFSKDTQIMMKDRNVKKCDSDSKENVKRNYRDEYCLRSEPQISSNKANDKPGFSLNPSKPQNNSSGPEKNNLNTYRTDLERSQVEKAHANQPCHFQNDSYLQNNNSNPKKSLIGNSETSPFKYEKPAMNEREAKFVPKVNKFQNNNNIQKKSILGTAENSPFKYEKRALPARSAQVAPEVNRFQRIGKVLEESNLVTKGTVFETSGKKAATHFSSIQEKHITNKISQVDDKKIVNKKFPTDSSEEIVMRSPDYQNKLESPVQRPSQQSLSKNAKAGEDSDVKTVALEANNASPTILETSLSIKTSGSCYLTHFESPYTFWISLNDFLEAFTENTSLMGREISKLPPSNPIVCKVGETYGVMYMKEWCRATILSVKGNEVTIFFCDYGNQAVVKHESLRPLTEEMLLLPAQAVRCSVSRLKPKGSDTWSEAACVAVKKWLGEPMSKFMEFETLAKRGSVHAVDISINDMTMSKILLSGGFAEVVNYEPGLPHLSEINRGVNQDSPRCMANELPNNMDEINVEDSFPVVLKNLISVHKFMVLTLPSCDLLNGLTLLLQSEYSNSTTSYRPVQGELVAAKFSEDGNWYRAEALTIDGDNCTLFFVDYGNSEVQTMENIRRLTNQKLISVPKQALICSSFAVKAFSGYDVDVVNKEFCALLVAAFISEGQGLLVIKEKTKDTLLVDFLATSGAFLSEILDQRLLELTSGGHQNAKLNDGQNKPKNQTSSLSEHSMVNNTLSDLGTETVTKTRGTTAHVRVSFVKSPAEFYVRLNSKHELFLSMMKELNSSVMSSPVLSAISVGSLAAVQFSQDHIWYRGNIERTEGRKCLVCFIDYGNREEVMLSSLRVLPPSVHNLPAQAIRCHLDGKLENLTEKFVSEFKENFEDKSVDVIMCGSSSGSWSVQILLEGTDICQYNQNVQTPEKPIQNPAKNLNMEMLSDTEEAIPVLVTHIDSLSRLFISRKDKNLQSELCQVMFKLNKCADSLPHLENPVEGSVCAAQFSQDGSWYRACVVEICNNATCIVQFVDYGNKEEILMSALKKLEPAMTNLPGQAICCCLFGYESELNPSFPQQSSDTAAELNQKLQAEMLEKSFIVKVVDRKLDTWIIKLENEYGECLSNKFPPPSPQKSVSKLSDLIFEAPSEKEFEAFIFHINNLSDFYCQRYNKEVLEELQDLSDKIKDDVSKCDEDVKLEPVVNGVYTSRFEGSWYRCVVEEVRMPKVYIRYIDYGNSELIPASQLRPLNLDRLVVPVRLFKCKLNGVTVQENRNSPEIKNYLTLLQAHAIHLVIEGQQKDTFLVSLFFNKGNEKVNVAADLVGLSLAKFAQVVSPRKEDIPLQHDQNEDSEEDEEELKLQQKLLEVQLKLAQKRKQHKH